MKKIIPLCLCAVLLFSLASCREINPRPIDEINFKPDFARVIEESPGHILLEAWGATFEQVLEYYEWALRYVGAEQSRPEEKTETYWAYTGAYGEGRMVKIVVRDMGSRIQILVGYADEIDNP